ncbi:transposase [Microbulbifer sp. 2205BS26-8]|uniref:transposase n=1 Tax=Microbulbifer sp. 2205BS26-8 TaxID=3064386 RepID=UPI0035313699
MQGSFTVGSAAVVSLKGISTGEMEEALSVLVGLEARSLSASMIVRLKRQWKNEYNTWRTKWLDKDRWVYIWPDDRYSALRLYESKFCALVIIGVNKCGKSTF